MKGALNWQSECFRFMPLKAMARLSCGGEELSRGLCDHRTIRHMRLARSRGSASYLPFMRSPQSNIGKITRGGRRCGS